MKYIFVIGLLLSCSKPTLTASDELIITSEKCFVKYTIYRIVEHPTDSLRFQASGIIDCNYSREARHRIPVGKYLLMGETDGFIVNLKFEKNQIRFSVTL
ncbi:hypothetical protein [Phnomibacter ginsenosidimutans]|uniref:Uncharacterized protein n=1 Tax=Phnomibacter ginsenosidimutans TaxID=2676868 RepID=A0A6I6G8S1_9BACT|nr:hypothetical protein [Phnomibacter ginsenosidimutans]QGW28917.1 hypothetical protein GLV81_13145 [Phnomibacter ginsenosidimutans]